MSKEWKYRLFTLALALVVFFPLKNQLQNIFGKQHFEVLVNMTNTEDMPVEIFYNTGNGWESEKSISGLVTTSPAIVEIALEKHDTLYGIRVDFNSDHAIENLSVCVSSMQSRVDLPVEISGIRTNCLDYIEDSRGLIFNPICDDSFIEFKSDLSWIAPFTLDNWALNRFTGLLVLFVLFVVWGFRPFSITIQDTRPIHLALVSAFVIALLINGFWIVSGFAGPNSELENRSFATFPDSLDFNFPNRFNDWYTDHFGIRQDLTRFNGIIHLNLFEKTLRKDKVVLGKEVEMFPAGDFLEDDYKGKTTLNFPELNSMFVNISERKEYLNSLGKGYYVLLTPNKHTIYPQELGVAWRKFHASDGSMLSQVVEYLGQKDGIWNYICDVRPVLLEEKKKEQRLYYRTDIHWNGHGAYLGYQQLFSLISKEYKSLKPFAKDQFDIRSYASNDGDMARMLMVHNDHPRIKYEFTLKSGESYQFEMMTGLRPHLIYRTTNPDTTKPKAIIFRDSFSEELIQFFSLHFSETIYVWNQAFDMELMNQFDPDLVIQEVNEMLVLDFLMVNPPEVKKYINEMKTTQ